METTFETGAKTAQANNLVLCVMNDGATYERRKHCGFRMLQHGNSGDTFGELVQDIANIERAKGSRFPIASVSDAIAIVRGQTIAHCLELIRDEYNGGQITVERRGWFDGINGNTYWSTWLTIPCDGPVSSRHLGIPMSYGYGNQWQWDTVYKLQSIGFFPEFDKRTGYLSELPINFFDHGNGLKRNLYSGIYWGKPV